MASQAGLNRVGERGGRLLLALGTGAGAYATPTSGYGIVGSNDSGLQMADAIGFKTWRFQVIGASAYAAGYTVSVYGTIDPLAYDIFWSNNAYTGKTGTGAGSTLLPATSWELLEGTSAQSGTGLNLNPIVTGTSTSFAFSTSGIVAVRIVLTAVNSPGSSAQVYGFAIP